MIDGFATRTLDTSEVPIHLEIGGDGPPLLLIHGYPQTHVMWHRVAPGLAQRFTVVCPDLRGYGDSGKPPGGPDHADYAKRSMARDLVEVMEALGFPSFRAAGHDRGGRVLHRMCLDHPQRVTRAAVLDIVPTRIMFETVTPESAHGYYHWFFLAQAAPFPERLIGADPVYFLERKLGGWGTDLDLFAPAALAEYRRCFSDPACIHGSCEDYRAAAGIDLAHDRADDSTRISCPLLVLYGAKGLIAEWYDVGATWADKATDVQVASVDAGHFLAEEQPEETLRVLETFFREG